MMDAILKKLIDKQDLTSGEITEAIELGLLEKNPIQMGAFLALMEAKKITPDELVYVLDALFTHTKKVNHTMPLLDIVGTGGDYANTFNISTGSAILAAACGLKVAKHGNRSVSSQCGSADVIEEFGVCLNQTEKGLLNCLEKVGIGFMFAQVYNPAIKAVKEVRRALKVRTFFNLIGPLLNPARAQFMIVGVYDESLMELVSQVLLKMGKTALVVCSQGIDEITTISSFKALHVKNKEVQLLNIDPVKLGFPPARLDDLKGGDKSYNAQKLIEVLKGGQNPWSDTLILNVACALFLCGKAPSIEEGVKIAKKAHQEQKGFAKLNDWIKCSREGENE